MNKTIKLLNIMYRYAGLAYLNIQKNSQQFFLQFTPNFKKFTEDTYLRRNIWCSLVCRRLAAGVYRGCIRQLSGSSGSIRPRSLCCSSVETLSSCQRKTENTSILQCKLAFVPYMDLLKTKKIYCDDKVTTSTTSSRAIVIN